MQSGNNARGLKQKVAAEFRMFWAIAIYLAIMLGAFTWYRRFILSDVGISYLHYGSAIVQALILGKLILIGRALKIGKRYEGWPLATAVLIKAIGYAGFIALFLLLEHMIEGLVHQEAWGSIVRGLVHGGRDAIFARTLMIVVALIPFLAFLEADQALGEGTLYSLFFRRGTSGREGRQLN